MMNQTDIITRVNTVLTEGFEIPPEKLQPESTLFQDLELDSLDAIDLIVYLEEKLELKVDTEQFKDIKTLNDVYQLVQRLQTKTI